MVGRDIVPPVSDSVRLTVDEYRSRLYEVLPACVAFSPGMGSRPACSRPRPRPRPDLVEAKLRPRMPRQVIIECYNAN